ncbi:MAG: MFS transporter [Tabrizicola sp.]|uniref:MFS transporter n=1 Tax=Tabrizicola sp. TaxID=2005166 RepID=UPI003BB0970D|nr:MFS transporter [Tabrizicola sp.]
MTTMTARPEGATFLPLLVILGLSHLLNDLTQSLIPAIYPILKAEFALDLVQIGMITLTFQIAGSLFQPVVGLYTDKHPLPYSSAVGMGFTLAGVTALAFAPSYAMILASVACIGIGSSIFHPEATRMARYAAQGRAGLAQGIFQVGGQVGGAVAPLAAALIIVPLGQKSLAGFAVAPIIAMLLLARIASQHDRLREAFHSAAQAARSRTSAALTPGQVRLGLVILVLLMASKLAYLESFRSFYTFYVIETFGVSIPQSQVLLFVIFISSAIGVLIGGMVGDRIGRHRIIWISILGPLPLTLLLPHVGLTGTVALTVLINLIMASAFASIMLYAMELMPGRIGLVGGVFYGLNFALGGLAAALLGALADRIGLHEVYVICSFLPLVGLVTWFLPKTGV